MKALWTQETAWFDGEFVNCEELVLSEAEPEPHPPVLIGAAPTAGNLGDIAEWADGWIPVRVFIGNSNWSRTSSRVRRQVEAAGRDPEKLKITVVDTSGAMGWRAEPRRSSPICPAARRWRRTERSTIRTD